ncbi:hypothetical protein HID58_069769, partial [Brassica napus]
ANLEALDTATRELRERRVDLSRRVSLEEDKGLERLAKVEGWLSRAESIDSEVSDLLREEPTETKRLCLFGYCSKNCISSCKYGKKVSKKLEEVKELLSKGVFEELAEKRPASKVVKKDIQTTIGLDSMVGKAWDSIMKPEGRTLGIYGMGGVGKTTLLARINNKFDKEVNEFDVVIWVVVSKDLQYKVIQDQILRRLRADQELEKETEEKKASFIDNILRRKKFILLLDDLWSAVDLNKIGVPRPTQENGSKIVFTTRSKKVCRDMEADDELKMDCLSTNEAWELFQNVVGEAPLKKDPEILTLAEKISKKCHGLPLALNVIGKAMSFRAHLLTESETTVKMHDVLRSTSGKEEEKQCVKSGVKLSCIPDDINWSVSRRISLMSNQIEKISCFPKCPNLSTLFLRDNDLKGIPGKFFQFMPSLIVLDLSHNRSLRDLPEEICSLTSLKYLNLSYTRISSLSVGLKGLRKLISLDLEFTKLKSIDGIGASLPNLQVLKLYRSRHYIDARSIEELQLLKHLKILTGNVTDASILESIQGVEGLVRCVQRLRIINMSAKDLTLNTVALGGLRELEIINSKISEIKIDWKCKGKEDLPSQYFKHLFSIVIHDLEGPKELSWLLFAPNLKHLEVIRSPSLEEIINKEKGMSISNVHPPDMTVPFPKLESLTLRGLPELERICSSPQALPSLKDITHCPKLSLESFQDTSSKKTTVGEQSSSSVSAAVQLRKLRVSCWSAKIAILIIEKKLLCNLLNCNEKGDTFECIDTVEVKSWHFRQEKKKSMERTKYFPRSKPLCRVSDPANHHTLCRRSDPPLSICFACKDHHLKRNRYYYYCSTCDLEFHRGCHLLPPKVSHPFHPHLLRSFFSYT